MAIIQQMISFSLHETTGITNPWQYVEGYFESRTGLGKCGTRYYDPAFCYLLLYTFRHGIERSTPCL